MPRFKPVEKGMLLLPVDLEQQIVAGSFEHALCYLVDRELDLDGLRGRFKNDEQGAAAYDPAVLLKIVLLAYSRGIVGSRKIEAACRQNILFMAVSGDSQPHFTTLAAFVSDLGETAAKLFAQVLLVCDRQGLIGREMFAIDGVKLPSNAAKAKSGTRADFQRQAERWSKPLRPCWPSTATAMLLRRMNRIASAKRSSSNAYNARPPNCANGSKPTRKTAKT